MTENIQICGDRKLTIIDGQYDVGNVCCKEQVGEYVLCKKKDDGGNKDDGGVGGKKTKKELASELLKYSNKVSDLVDEYGDDCDEMPEWDYDYDPDDDLNYRSEVKKRTRALGHMQDILNAMNTCGITDGIEDVKTLMKLLKEMNELVEKEGVMENR